MDTDRLLRIFGRMMDLHGPIFIGSFAAIIGLLLLVFIMRKIKARKAAIRNRLKLRHPHPWRWKKKPSSISPMTATSTYP